MAAVLTVFSKQTPFPFAAIAIAYNTGKADVVFDEAATGISLALNGSTITSEAEIVQALAKEGGLSEDSSKVSVERHRNTCNLTDERQTASFFALAKTLQTVTAFPDTVAALDSLDDYLSFRTFLVGHETTAADWIVWGTLKGE